MTWFYRVGLQGLAYQAMAKKSSIVALVGKDAKGCIFGVFCLAAAGHTAHEQHNNPYRKSQYQSLGQLSHLPVCVRGHHVTEQGQLRLGCGFP